MFSLTEQSALYPDPRPAVTDEEVAAVQRAAISHAGGLRGPRSYVWPERNSLLVRMRPPRKG
jgi:hypothetical protein